jgi:hypothetical protein
VRGVGHGLVRGVKTGGKFSCTIPVRRGVSRGAEAALNIPSPASGDTLTTGTLMMLDLGSIVQPWFL